MLTLKQHAVFWESLLMENHKPHSTSLTLTSSYLMKSNSMIERHCERFTSSKEHTQIYASLPLEILVSLMPLKNDVSWNQMRNALRSTFQYDLISRLSRGLKKSKIVKDIEASTMIYLSLEITRRNFPKISASLCPRNKITPRDENTHQPLAIQRYTKSSK
jgi:hypothetical protein